MVKAGEKLFTTLDLYISSFFAFHGIPPNLEIKNGKVVFVFPATDDLYKLLMDFNSNVNVPVADFVTMIKTLRGQMLTMREGRRNER